MRKRVEKLTRFVIIFSPFFVFLKYVLNEDTLIEFLRQYPLFILLIPLLAWVLIFIYSKIALEESKNKQFLGNKKTAIIGTLILLTNILVISILVLFLSGLALLTIIKSPQWEVFFFSHIAEILMKSIFVLIFAWGLMVFFFARKVSSLLTEKPPPFVLRFVAIPFTILSTFMLFDIKNQDQLVNFAAVAAIILLNVGLSFYLFYLYSKFRH